MLYGFFFKGLMNDPQSTQYVDFFLEDDAIAAITETLVIAMDEPTDAYGRRTPSLGLGVYSSVYFVRQSPLSAGFRKICPPQDSHITSYNQSYYNALRHLWPLSRGRGGRDLCVNSSAPGVQPLPPSLSSFAWQWQPKFFGMIFFST